MIQTNINPIRRNEIKQIVYKTLCNYQPPCIPVKIKSLVRSFPQIRLIAYSKHMHKMNISYKQMLCLAGTMDAYTDYYAHEDLYIIYYNDIEKSITLSNRYRWDIAHELGHIMLSHHKLYSKTRIFRNKLSKQEYDVLEAEADYFAQLILVPHVVLYAFKIRTATQLKDLCQISGPAATRRFYAYRQWKNNIDGSDAYDRPLFHYYYNFIYKKNCHICGAHFIQCTGKYCPICGNKSLKWGDGEMKYITKINLNENGKAIKCPVCENEEVSQDGKYCHICGTYLINHCTNEPDSYEGCGRLASGNARYCIYCGAETTFLKNGILKPWNLSDDKNMPSNLDDDILPTIDEELPFN